MEDACASAGMSACKGNVIADIKMMTGRKSVLVEFMFVIDVSQYLKYRDSNYAVPLQHEKDIQIH